MKSEPHDTLVERWNPNNMSKPLPLLVLLLCTSAFAQTTYTQSAPQHCTLSDWVCNGIPLSNGNLYQVDGPYAALTTGSFFSLYVGGVSHNGKVTAVKAQPPLTAPYTCKPGTICSTGTLELSFSTTDGLTGTVSANVSIEKVCGRYCWPLVWIESSTVTVN